MKTPTEKILNIMLVLTWIAFIGLMVEAGIILVSYVITCIKPEITKNLYLGAELSKLMQLGFWNYSIKVYFMFSLLGMKAFIAFLVIKTLSKVNLANPFTAAVSQRIALIGYVLLANWFVSLLNHIHANWLLKQMGEPEADYAAVEFLFIAGLVFIISQIFKRGVELQAENELTV